MRVDIYITSQFTGRVTRGHGVYGIVLVTEINGKKYAKAHMAGWNDISYQKLSARAVVDEHVRTGSNSFGQCVCRTYGKKRKC